MLKARVLTALILVAGFLLALFLFNAQFWAILISAVVWLAAQEWCLLLKAGRIQSILFQSLVALAVLAFGFMSPHLGASGKIIATLIYAGSLSLWFLSIPSFMRLSVPVKAGYVGYLIGFWILFAAGVAILTLRDAGPWVLLAAMVPVWLADIAAFFTGRQFGKHKLAPSISPGKTWEGATGALCAVMVYAMLVRLQIPANLQPNVILTLCIALIYTAISIIGDLFESMVKRQAGVKDSGSILPGHGGVLDRIDSLLPTLPLAAVLILWFR